MLSSVVIDVFLGSSNRKKKSGRSGSVSGSSSSSRSATPTQQPDSGQPALQPGKKSKEGSVFIFK